jgi:predicted methyltransferase
MRLQTSSPSQANNFAVSGLVRWTIALCAVLALAACASQGGASSGSASKSAKGGKWKTEDLAAALTSSSRAQADKDRDADRKPADLMTFLGVEKGMTTMDVIAAQGYVTEVLSITVGPTGKVYMQNPAQVAANPNNAKGIEARLANNRLSNVTRVDGDLPNAAIPAGSVDVAITAMNLHDVYNRNADAAGAFMKNVFTELKPGGVFGVIDHVGVAGADNAKLHRMQKQQAIDVAKAAGFVVEAESNVLAHAGDDHTKGVFDPTLRGHTDQFALRLRKPK